MAHFLLASDVNLGIGRWLRGRGNEITRAEDAGSERPSPDQLVRVAVVSRGIIVTHDERLFADLTESDSSAVTILIVPQPSLDDIPRIAESIHQFVAKDRAGSGRHRLGLGSGWAALD